ncbi:DUF3265 domain-containing protein [Vibrio vulnificus]|nr:DUF3265 domain-containing protein [Vibrio vulnificus]
MIKAECGSIGIACLTP